MALFFSTYYKNHPSFLCSLSLAKISLIPTFLNLTTVSIYLYESRSSETILTDKLDQRRKMIHTGYAANWFLLFSNVSINVIILFFLDYLSLE